MRVRRATVDDAEAIARVQERAWHAAYRHVFPADRLDAFRIDRSRWRARLADPPDLWTAFVAEDAGAVAGFVACGPAHGDSSGEVYAIYVDPDCWGAGAGRALLARAEKELRSIGAEEATLWVLEDNPRARGFYEVAGWAADGAEKRDTFLRTEVVEVRYRKRLA